MCFESRLPAAIEQLSFPMQFQRTPVLVTPDSRRLTIAVNREGVSAPMIKVGIGDDVRELCPGDRHVWELESATPAGEPQITG